MGSTEANSGCKFYQKSLRSENTKIQIRNQYPVLKMDVSSENSSSSSDLSLKLKYPIFKVKHPCDGVPPRAKKTQRATDVEATEDVESVKSQDIPWLSRYRQFCKLIFDEKLIICKTLDKMVGEATINVYLTEENDYILHTDWILFDTEWCDGSSEVFDNTSFTSLIRRNLITVEEKYCELDRKREVENHLYVCERVDFYDVTYTVQKDSQIISRESCEISFDICKDILSQGSLILLLRQMTVLNILEIDPLHILMTDGKLYDIIFNMEDFHCVLFDSKVEILVKKIVATIASPDTGETLEEVTTFLSENGRIVYQEWKNKGVVLRFDPRTPRKDIQAYYCKRYPLIKPPTALPLSEVWRQDIQLNSMYNQRTRALQQEFESFYVQRPDLRGILRDYLKDLLIRKPNSPLIYTAIYFKNFVF